ncbi:MAG: hypothetical protein K0S32_931 [Bacteroidetes bacterium]|jgi:hypothetical protein|nr:hypothetical protein [Bacteroidota bacterium]
MKNKKKHIKLERDPKVPEKNDPTKEDDDNDRTIPQPNKIKEPERNDPTRIDDPDKVDPTRIDDPDKLPDKNPTKFI